MRRATRGTGWIARAVATALMISVGLGVGIGRLLDVLR